MVMKNHRKDLKPADEPNLSEKFIWKDIKMIEIAHSMPRLIDPEITEQVTWTVEYRIPVKMLEKYSRVTYPEPGISWKANFYKIAENSSNPHYLTWSEVQNPTPDFHLPQYFGVINFK